MARRRFIYGWRRAALSLLIVLGGVATALVTVLARRTGDWEMARLGAILSLVFVVLMLVFVVPPLARSARLEAARLDLPVQFTGGGLVFLGVLAIVGFAAWNTGNNLLFLLLSAMMSALFVAWAVGGVTLRDLVVTARFPDHIFAGEPAPAIVAVQNLKRLLPSFSVLVEARVRIDPPQGTRPRMFRRPRFEKRTLAYFMYAPRRAKAEQEVEQTFARRGHALVTGFEISTRFPFGFLRLRRRLRARDVDIVVYPRPRPAGDELHLLPVNAGQMASARRGAGQDLHSLRDYRPHDDVRHIDWKATARADRLTVREFTAEDERRVHIVLDTRAEERAAGQEKKRRKGRRGGADDDRDASAQKQPTFEERFEEGVTLAASLVAHFIEERADVRLTLGVERGDYGAGREHLYASLRRLALVVPDAQKSTDDDRQSFWEMIAPAARAPGENFVILLTTQPPGSIPSHAWRASHVIYV
jgi:uncharacterized protein (DUF58 family)